MLGEAERFGDTEADRVESWRLGELLAAGYPLEHAEQIAARDDIDLHQARQLIRNGCPPETAARILL
jgi:hypothetical protein